MKKNHVSGLILLTMLAASLLLILPTTQAYSSEVTGLQVTGFDNNQQTFVKIDTHNIFLFDNKLVDYDNSGALTGSLDYPAMTSNVSTGNSAEEPIVYCASAIAFNSTHLLMVRVGTWANGYGSSPDSMRTWFEFALVNVATYAYSLIHAGYYSSSTTFTINQLANDYYANSRSAIFVNTNATGTFYYTWMSSELLATYPNPDNYDNQEVFYYIGKTVVGVDTWAASRMWVKEGFQLASDTSYMRGCNIVVDPTLCPENYRFFLTSNAWTGGNRANIYMIKFTAPFTISYVGVTTLDDSYTGGLTAIGKVGMAYLMAQSTESARIRILVSYSLDSGDNIGISLIQFNSTTVSQESRIADESRNGGVLTSDSLNVRPFAVKLGSGQGAILGDGTPLDGIYSIGYFRDYATPNVESLVAIDYSYVAGGSPAFTYSNFYRPWEEAHIYPYTACLDYGGFQPYGSTVGCYVDMANGACEAEGMSILSNDLQLQVELTGGYYYVMSHLGLYSQPAFYTLDYNEQYTAAVKVLSGGVVGTSGTIEIGISALSASNTIFSTSTYTTTASDYANGLFTFYISPRSGTYNQYQKIQINVTTSTGYNIVKQYNFEFAATGAGSSGSDNTGTGPGLTAPPIPSGGQNLGGAGGVGLVAQGSFINYIAYGLLIFGPGVFLGFVAGVPGVLIGATFSLIGGVVVGFIPFWAVFLVGLVILLLVYERRSHRAAPAEEA